MSKYAVIEIGGKQEKVSVGDTFETVSPAKIKSLVPLLLSLRKGSLVSDKTVSYTHLTLPTKA